MILDSHDSCLKMPSDLDGSTEDEVSSCFPPFLPVLRVKPAMASKLTTAAVTTLDLFSLKLILSKSVIW